MSPPHLHREAGIILCHGAGSSQVCLDGVLEALDLGVKLLGQEAQLLWVAGDVVQFVG